MGGADCRMQNLENCECRYHAAAEAWLASPYLAPAMEQARLRGSLRVWARENGMGLLEGFQNFEQPLIPPAACRATELIAPTLLMIGTRVLLDIRKIVQHLGCHVRNSTTIEFQRVGHMINLEAPETFNQQVLAFLNKV